MGRTVAAALVVLAVATGCGSGGGPGGGAKAGGSITPTPVYVADFLDCPLMPIAEIQKIVPGHVLTAMSDSDADRTQCKLIDRQDGRGVLLLMRRPGTDDGLPVQYTKQPLNVGMPVPAVFMPVQAGMSGEGPTAEAAASVRNGVVYRVYHFVDATDATTRVQTARVLAWLLRNR